MNIKKCRRILSLLLCVMLILSRRKLGTVLLFLSPCFMETGGQKQKDRPRFSPRVLCP